jgi:hypothetical protein
VRFGVGAAWRVAATVATMVRFGSGGGGVSDGAFPRPAYQEQANVPNSVNPRRFKGRGVPDVTADGDPGTGYNILVDGQPIQEGGTSAVAPLWAALIAVINQKLGGRVGFVNPQLYALAAGSGAFHDITTGNNRVSFPQFKDVGYDAGVGWDASSGLGLSRRHGALQPSQGRVSSAQNQEPEAKTAYSSEAVGAHGSKIDLDGVAEFGSRPVRFVLAACEALWSTHKSASGHRFLPDTKAFLVIYLAKLVLHVPSATSR